MTLIEKFVNSAMFKQMTIYSNAGKFEKALKLVDQMIREAKGLKPVYQFDWEESDQELDENDPNKDATYDPNLMCLLLKHKYHMQIQIGTKQIMEAELTLINLTRIIDENLADF